MAEKVGDLYAELKLKKDNFEKNLTTSEKRISKFKGIATKSFGIVSKAMAALGVAMVAIGIKSAKMASEFEKNMREVNTLARLGEEQFNDLKKAVISLSNRLGKDSTEMAKALYQIVSAGYSGNEAMRLLETGIEMAIGGVAEQTESVDALTTVMNAYGKSVGESKQVGDTFFQTIKYGKTTMTELAGAIGNVATPAALAGVSFEELSAAVAALSIVGVKTDKAIIGLRQLMMGVIKPSEQAKQAAAQMGLQFDLAALQSKGLAGFLKSVVDATGGSVDEMAKLFPNVRAITALLPLTTNASGKFADILGKMTTESGALNDAVEEMNKSFARQYEMTKTKTSNIMKKLGMGILPAFTASLNGMIPALDEITILMDDMQKEGEGLAEFFSGFGKWVGKASIVLIRFVNNAREAMTDLGAHLTNGVAQLLEMGTHIPKIGKKFEGAAHSVRMLNQGFVQQGIDLQANEDKYNTMLWNLEKGQETFEDTKTVIDGLSGSPSGESSGSGINGLNKELEDNIGLWTKEEIALREMNEIYGNNTTALEDWINETEEGKKAVIDWGDVAKVAAENTGEMFATMIKSGGDANTMIKRLIGQLIRMTLLSSLGPLGGAIGGFMRVFGFQEGGMTNMPMMNMRPDLAVANENPNVPEAVVPFDKMAGMVKVEINEPGPYTNAKVFLDATKLPDDVKDKFTRDVIKPALSRDTRR